VSRALSLVFGEEEDAGVELRIAAAWYALDKLPSEEAINAAHEVLNRGVHSDSLGMLICQEPRWSEIGPLFERALVELGIGVPDRAAAVRLLAEDFARRIIADELTPYEGARAIWRELSWEPEARESLLPFVGLASEWEDRPEFRHEYEADILQVARELVEGGNAEQSAPERPRQ
jgi:hypothetical protein